MDKIASWIKSDELVADIDLSEMPVPSIFFLMQVAFGLDDKRAMNKWNMGLPYAITCKAKDVDEIIQLAETEGITARVIGKVSKKDTDHTAHTIKGVGLGKSSFEFWTKGTE